MPGFCFIFFISFVAVSLAAVHFHDDILVTQNTSTRNGGLVFSTATAMFTLQSGCPCPSFSSSFDASAVIIEAQPSTALSFSISSTLRALSPSLLVIVVTSHNARAWLIEEFPSALRSGRLQHWELASDGTRGLLRLCGSCVAERVIPAKLARDAYRQGGAGAWPLNWKLANEVIFRPEIYLIIPSDAFVVFQIDSFFCASVNISSLLTIAAAYDYVEVSRAYSNYKGSIDCNKHSIGLSLSSKSMMQRLILEFDNDVAIVDSDEGFCRRNTGITALSDRIPSYVAPTSKRTEGWGLDSDSPLGFNKPWVFASTPREWEIFAAKCPVVEAAMVVNAPDGVMCVFLVPCLFFFLLVARIGVIMLVRNEEGPLPDEEVNCKNLLILLTLFTRRAFELLRVWTTAIILHDTAKAYFKSPRRQSCMNVLFFSLLFLIALTGCRAFFSRCEFMQRPGYLSTVCTPGRLGNRLFHNLAASALAEKYDLATEYDEDEAFTQLGLPLAFGSRRMVAGPAILVDDARFEELIAAPSSSVLDARFQLSTSSFFQYHAFACRSRAWLRSPFVRNALLAANPWRERANANDDVFVHLRLGDIDKTHPHSSRAYTDYISAIVNVTATDGGRKKGRIVVASDEPNRFEVRAIVDHFSGEILDLDRISTWQFGMLCKHLVLSESTFSWAVAAMHFQQPDSNIRILKRRHIDGWMGSTIFDFDDWIVLK